jgi:hydroxyquinol 1,2-dioxygenase
MPMSDYNQERLTQDVLDAFAGTPDPRLRELMSALVKHIHAFAREVDLTPEEWLAGLKFLNATGQISTERRPEFILLSDTLGLSMMVVALAQKRASGGVKGAMAATEATVEGPFY